jgi:hypothetical protein
MLLDLIIALMFSCIFTLVTMICYIVFKTNVRSE